MSTSDTDWAAIRDLMNALFDGVQALDREISDDIERQHSLHGPLGEANVMDLLSSANTIASDLRYKVIKTGVYNESTRNFRQDLRTLFLSVSELASELIGHMPKPSEDGLPTEEALAVEMDTARLAKFLKDVLPNAMSGFSMIERGQTGRRPL